jgi:tRNA 2-selenouridine synthase
VIQTLDVADRKSLARFDTIIDVRSPGEFAEDHVPGAVNLPVLGDEERALVGYVYVQKSRFDARRLGAAIVARNIASHLEGDLSTKSPAFAPLIYCWRGGQRSAAMATVFDQIGWRPTLLRGGYKSYRREVCASLSRSYPPIVLLSGHTGTAKTAILSEVGSRGAQVLDLENLANHRGSLLGGFAGRPQPSQKWFESQLLGELAALDHSKPVLMEAESSKIGDVNIPEPLWKEMRAAPMIEIKAPTAARARYLLAAYRDLTFDPERLIAALARLPSRHGQGTVNGWIELVEMGRYEELVSALMEIHYDPACTRWNKSHPHSSLEVLASEDLSRSFVSEAAGRIVEILRNLEL